jgi:hypothetical protein
MADEPMEEENNEPGYERSEDGEGREKIRVKKIPLEDMLNILEGLYEAGTNYIDLEFFIDPNMIQSVITITTRPEYISTPEELEAEKLIDDALEDDDEEDEEDDILNQIKKQQEAPEEDSLSDDDINELM